MDVETLAMIAAAVTAIATVALAVTSFVANRRSQQLPKWFGAEWSLRRPALVEDASRMLLAAADSPVVSNVVEACFEAWKLALLANPSPRRVDAIQELLELLNTQLEIQMENDYAVARKRRNDRLEPQTVDYRVLTVESAHRIARTLPCEARWKFTNEFWQCHDSEIRGA